MKIDRYFPHDTLMRQTPEIIVLIEKENASGYGMYWVILEYLRTQEGYVGDIRAIKGLARQVNCRLPKALRILNDYGLFVVEGDTFYSPALNEMMRPLEAKKRRKKVQPTDKTVSQKDISLSEEVKGASEASCNTLVMNEDSSKRNKNKEDKKETSNKEKGDVALPLAWERYVDELAKEQQWIEIMAMRSGMGQVFVQRFGEVLQHFKRHVQAVGNEKDIQTPSDAKRYFCFFNTPGSPTFARLVSELQKPVDKGKYKFEDRDPVTGQRSYCGVSIPEDAPPRPNEQAVWSDGKWFF